MREIGTIGGYHRPPDYRAPREGPPIKVKSRPDTAYEKGLRTSQGWFWTYCVDENFELCRTLVLGVGDDNGDLLPLLPRCEEELPIFQIWEIYRQAKDHYYEYELRAKCHQ